jgi:hypothetical protein
MQNPADSAETIHRATVLPDHYLLTKDDSDVISHILGGQNFAYFYKENGPITWGAFGESFATVGELRRIAADHPVEDAVADPLNETVGIELFGNMLDTIAFLRVRLRALADIVIESGIVTGPELLSRYNQYHERSYEAYRDLMLLQPEVFEQRFAEWLQTERAFRNRLAKPVKKTTARKKPSGRKARKATSRKTSSRKATSRKTSSRKTTSRR